MAPTRTLVLASLVCLASLGCGRIRYQSRDTGTTQADANVDAFSLDASGMDAPDTFISSDAGPMDAPVDSPDAPAPLDTPEPPDSSEPDADCRCSIHASCVVGLGCTCNAGYAGDGTTCLSTRWATGDIEAFVKASNTGAGDGFGRVVVSGDGNTMVVGAYQEDTSGVGVNPPSDEAAVDSGAVYVYVRSGATWSFQTFLKASNTGPDDAFGFGIALSADGNTLAVGSFTEDSSGTGVGSVPDDGASNSGAVYIFTRTGTTWSEQAFIKASNAGARDAFGFAVALSGDGNTLVVGAPFEGTLGNGINPTPNNSALNSGAVYVYYRVGTTWSFAHFIKASNTGPSDSFGVSLALSADGATLAVAASGEDGSATGVGGVSNEGANGSGAVYVYSRSGSAWAFQEYIKASNTGLSDGFGYSVALSTNGDTLAVGADQEDSSGVGVDSAPDEAAPGSGAVYVYQRTGGVWAFQAFIKATNTETSDTFAQVTLSGNGNLLAVGAAFESSSGTNIGSVPNEASFNSGCRLCLRAHWNDVGFRSLRESQQSRPRRPLRLLREHQQQWTHSGRRRPPREQLGLVRGQCPR